jgi:predicted aminopeptidase
MNSLTLEQKLELIKDVKRFCVDELGVPENNSFTKIVNHKYEEYYLFVSYRNKIESIFEDYYCKGFKTALICNAFEKVYRLRGFDTYISKALSYVTKDSDVPGDDTQINQAILASPEISIVKTIIHENTHIAVGFNDYYKLDLAIEEPLAVYMGYAGALLYYKNNPAYVKKIKSVAKFCESSHQWTNKTQRLLESQYRVDYDKARLIFEREKPQYKRFINNDASNFNNAFFLSTADYSDNYVAVRQILQYTPPKDILRKIAHSKEIRTLSDLNKIIISNE